MFIQVLVVCGRVCLARACLLVWRRSFETRLGREQLPLDRPFVRLHGRQLNGTAPIDKRVDCGSGWFILYSADGRSHRGAL